MIFAKWWYRRIKSSVIFCACDIYVQYCEHNSYFVITLLSSLFLQLCFRSSSCHFSVDFMHMTCLSPQNPTQIVNYPICPCVLAKNFLVRNIRRRFQSMVHCKLPQKKFFVFFFWVKRKKKTKDHEDDRGTNLLLCFASLDSSLSLELCLFFFFLLKIQFSIRCCMYIDLNKNQMTFPSPFLMWPNYL